MGAPFLKINFALKGLIPILFKVYLKNYLKIKVR